jgi:trimeric autotransporter adhesin
MRRFVSFLAVLLFTVPVGISLSGCSKTTANQYCEGSSGIRIGQVTSIVLTPQYYGKSLSYGQTDTVTTPTASDCKGTSVSISAYKYASSNPSLVDINPSTGSICAGTWNRNTPGGTADYTFCTAAAIPASGTSLVTASGGGATSNSITVYVHPAIAAITLGSPTTNCTTDPTTNCCPITSTAISATPYDANSCVSQNDTRQIVARAFDNDGHNITCQVGHPSYTPVTSGLVVIDENGVATAQQPGSTIVQATIARSTSNAGFFSTCPPASISINTPNAVSGTVGVTPNTVEPITATVLDTKGINISGLALTYTSTTPTTITASTTGILATYPSSTAVNAFCMPPTCNPSPYTNIGQFGNGKPVVSNTIQATASGLNSTLLYIASTQSQYITTVDFTNTQVGAPVRLPYVPNSMVLSEDGSSIYFGTDTELISFSTSTLGVTKEDISAKGRVLAVAPDNSSIVLTDPTRNTVTLYVPSSSTTTTSFQGIGLRAEYSPDAQAVYVTTSTNHLLVYSVNTGWHDYDMSATGANDVAVTVPAVGAYVGGNSAITGRSYCANTTVNPVDYYPVAGQVGGAADRVAATNDSKHILALSSAAGGVPVLNDVNVGLPTGMCPLATPNSTTGVGATFTNTLNTVTLSSINAAPCTTLAALTTPYPICGNVIPSSDSAVAFVTYPATSTAGTTGTLLPAYKPAASGPGALSYVTLASGATAPVAGVFSSDNGTFYVGTSGDNLVHLIKRSTLTDGSQINPKLPAFSGSGFATPNLFAQKPRSTT